LKQRLVRQLLIITGNGEPRLGKFQILVGFDFLWRFQNGLGSISRNMREKFTKSLV
jgi:hypothetical protein